MMKYITKSTTHNSVFDLVLKLFSDRHSGQKKIIPILFCFFSLQSRPSSSFENNTDETFSPDDYSLVNGKRKTTLKVLKRGRTRGGLGRRRARGQGRSRTDSNGGGRGGSDCGGGNSQTNGKTAEKGKKKRESP